MEKIIAYLIEAEKDKSYQTPFGFDNESLKGWINPDDLIEINKEESSFSKNRLYKLAVCKKFGREIPLEAAFWIINDWGGIGSFKENERNNGKIKLFLNKLKNGLDGLTRQEFSTISSLSKVSFFYDADKYCIYDSRVIYSLNWIIFKTNEEGIKFFPMPNGRNKIIANYPMDAIIKFSLLQRGVANFKDFYYSHKEAYKKYNQMMAIISKAIFGGQSKPFFAEMLLFGIADDYVHRDMKKEITIKINSWESNSHRTK